MTFARPGDVMVVKAALDEHLDHLFDFRATISVDGQVIMRNCFRVDLRYDASVR
jgi:hypothetical protein